MKLIDDGGTIFRPDNRTALPCAPTARDAGRPVPWMTASRIADKILSDDAHLSVKTATTVCPEIRILCR